jgi:hypothetical protein
MRDIAKLTWIPFISALAIVVVAAVVVQSCNQEGTMSEGNETIALDVSIPLIDTQVPEVIETATFALG